MIQVVRRRIIISSLMVISPSDRSLKAGLHSQVIWLREPGYPLNVNFFLVKGIAHLHLNGSLIEHPPTGSERKAFRSHSFLHHSSHSIKNTARKIDAEVVLFQNTGDTGEK